MKTCEEWWGSVEYAVVRTRFSNTAAKHGRPAGIMPEVAEAIRAAYNAGAREAARSMTGAIPAWLVHEVLGDPGKGFTMTAGSAATAAGIGEGYGVVNPCHPKECSE